MNLESLDISEDIKKAEDLRNSAYEIDDMLEKKLLPYVIEYCELGKFQEIKTILGKKFKGSSSGACVMLFKYILSFEK